MSLPNSQSTGSVGDASQQMPQTFSLESFRCRTSTKPATVPISSPSTRRPSQYSYARKSPAKADKNIARIDKNASHAIRAAHTILDPAAIIKELIENALDARATRIDVRVRGKGALDTLTISDNGHGISSSDYESLCLPSTTSKISSFGDLEKLNTFGFRGEALSAICAIAKVITVTTRTSNDSIATALKYSKDGCLVSQKASARPVGTTVQVESVFDTLPVRRKDAIKNHTREVARCVAVVQALALISVNTRIELKIGGEVKVGNLPSMIDPKALPSSLSKVSLSALRCNAKTVLGTRTANALIEISNDTIVEVTIPPSARAAIRADEKDASENDRGATAAYGCHGLISKASLDANGSGGRARSSHQYIFVNRRPVDFPRLTRTIRESYRRATGMNGAAPVVLLNLVLPAWSCDVNLAPDKRVICVHEEDVLIAGVVSLLEDIWIPTKATAIPVQQDSDLTHMIQSKPTVDVPDKPLPQSSADLSMIDIPNEPSIHALMDPASTDQRGEEAVRNNDNELVTADSTAINPGRTAPSGDYNKDEDATQRSRPDDGDNNALQPSEAEPAATAPNAPLLSFSPPSALPVERQQSSIGKTEYPWQEAPYQRRSRESLIHNSTKNSTTRNVSSFIARRSRSLIPAKRPRSAKFTWPVSNMSKDETTEKITEGGKQVHEKESEVNHEEPRTETIFDEPASSAETLKPVAAVNVNWDEILETMCKDGDTDGRSQDGARCGEGQTFKDATLGKVDNEIVTDAHHRAAENEMSRLFHQQWFKDLDILGQFNRGFIIARLRNDLFIIDQHASDEKYNFEDLQRNTVISKQRLVQPLNLEFSAQDELLVAQHLDAFRAGGFDIEYREENPPTRRLVLKAQPISKHTIFVQDDLRDIVDMLKSSVVRSSSMKIKVLRPPRVRAMFASRACRKSIMIGTALQRPQMEKIVRNLATLEHPWTCPHGRPTMRHLCSLPG